MIIVRGMKGKLEDGLMLKEAIIEKEIKSTSGIVSKDSVKRPLHVSQFSISPAHTTHSGGKGEHLHDWYQYLEGYSSEFVHSIVKSYFPNAKSIIDPFAGVGTTPVKLTMLGIDCFYSEINPAMRKIIETKLAVLKLKKAQREKLHDKIHLLANNLTSMLPKAREDKELQLNYDNSFGTSLFFSEDVYHKILRLRTIADMVAIDDALLSSVLEVAIMSKLIKCSMLRRAGDLRYKTKRELVKDIPDFIEAIKSQLILIANDCINCQYGDGVASMVTDNAKKLGDLEKLNVDGVITSPPYLNGTNYFRNTKLELWFIRQIVNNKSLRAFRDDTIISGINDVTSKKGKIIHPSMNFLHKELLKQTYDQRIPKMVAGYFEEMGLVFAGLRKHMKKGGIACIDIGDSVYSGVHIPTHDILVEVAKDYGLELLNKLTLRDRKSNNGALLTQTLLVFENHVSNRKSTAK